MNGKLIKHQMLHSKISAASYLFLCFTLSITLITNTTEAGAADESYNANYCPNNSATYSANSTYRTNLNQLLSWLSSNASTRQNGYYNTTIIGVNDDAIYGAFLCRGDLTTNACQACVSSASKTLLQQCPNEKAAVIWLNECMVRSSDQSFFSVAAEGPPLYTYYGPNVMDMHQSSFMELLSKTMKAAVDLAANGGDEKKYGTKEANISSFQTLYTLAQCTPDLTQLGCRECLGAAVGELPLCCSGKQGARILIPSCNIRYALFPFYSSQVAVSVPPVPQEQPRLNSEDKSRISAVVIIAVVASVVFVLLVTFIAFWMICPRASRKKHGFVLDESVEIPSAEFLQFEYDTIIGATNNFCDDNKLGEGGFGSVYKGTLSNGQDIAVKRLSRNSKQGVNEFKNEVFLVAKLQHKNLVRLLGFCLNGEEKMLIYEFVPNKSLDHFLFDPNRQQYLNWTRRYKIIEGITRGIHYLHEDSRLKIIHHDIKASNILLDENSDPKISDFGMARTFYGDQTHGITNRVVGTIGYLSPEYVIHGHFSVKVDVYSFGVLVLEIISGKKITSFYEPSYGGNLLNYAWNHFRDGTPLELLDMTLRDSYSSAELLRCIHIGLSCVQEDPAQRPTMQTIALMLNSHSVTLSAPERPAGYISSQTQLSLPTMPTMATNKPVLASASVDDSSITNVYAR